MRWVSVCLIIANAVLFLWLFLLKPWHNAKELKELQAYGSGVIDPDVPSLVLLSEHEVSQGDSTGLLQNDESDVPDKALEPVVAKEKELKRIEVVEKCRVVGRFTSVESVKQAMQVFVDLDFATEMIKTKIGASTTYWLTVDSGKVDTEAASELLSKLESLGVSAEKKREGELDGKIAAGPFLSKSVAESFLYRALAMGVEAQVETVLKTVFEYSVKLKWLPIDQSMSVEEALLAIKSTVSDKDIKQIMCN